ncbi:MAG: HAMP domain-containing sensor histidine kinase [Pseudomonadota bacterium]
MVVMTAAMVKRWAVAGLLGVGVGAAAGLMLLAMSPGPGSDRPAGSEIAAAQAAAGAVLAAIASDAAPSDLRRAAAELESRAQLANVAPREAERAVAALTRLERGAATQSSAILALATYKDALSVAQAVKTAGSAAAASATTDRARRDIAVAVALAAAICVAVVAVVWLRNRADRNAARRLTNALAAHAERGSEFSTAALTAGADPSDADRMAKLVEASAEREERLQAAIDERFAAETAQAEAAAALRTERDRAEAALEDLQAAQDSLIQSEKLAALGGLVAGVAHEVNTPIGVALTAATFLARRTQELQDALAAGKISKSSFNDYLASARESAALIEKNAARAAELIQSFKMVAVDQTSDARRSIRLADYLDELLTSLGPEMKRAAVKASVDPALDVEIDSFPGAISQVMTNLVMNSLIHAFPGRDDGRITIGGGPLGGDAVEIFYADDGVGLSDAAARHVFDPFFTTKRGSGGSGLGMNIVYNVVTSRLGGQIAFDPPPDGVGARFRLTLPRHAPRAAAA